MWAAVGHPGCRATLQPPAPPPPGRRFDFYASGHIHLSTCGGGRLHSLLGGGGGGALALVSRRCNLNCPPPPDIRLRRSTPSSPPPSRRPSSRPTTPLPRPWHVSESGVWGGGRGRLPNCRDHACTCAPRPPALTSTLPNSRCEDWGVFAAAFVVRPIGALLFGHIADTWGRSRAMLLSILAMAIPTTIIGQVWWPRTCCLRALGRLPQGHGGGCSALAA